jgi:hypothetical protein
MNIRRPFAGLWLGVAVLCLTAHSAPAGAQSDADLRRDNQRLKAQLQDTQQELEAARARIEELTGELESLRRAIAARGRDPARTPGAPAPPETVSIDESKADSSPRALFRAMRTSYEEAVKDQEIGQLGDRARKTYLRLVQSWATRANREFRTPVVWHVRYDSEIDQFGQAMLFRAVDPASGEPLMGAHPFRVSIPRKVARRLVERGEMREVLVVRGVLTPRVTFNAEREAQGTFDNPKFIGPFAEFNFVIDARSMLSMAEDEKSNRERDPARKPEKPREKDRSR